ncbi:MAG TPA: tetratricopeptide repeat protein [Acidobacteriaceae bacterium]|nr:tetratricopeptide repeat protein [Acidobacteriaceae bacterium]
MRPRCSLSSLQSVSGLLSFCRSGIPAILVFVLASPAGLKSQRIHAEFDSLSSRELVPQRGQTTSPLIEKELRLAGDYLIGRGVPKDPVQAAYWYRKAADQGDPGAQNQLGYLYTWGIGVERNQAEAFRWYARAAGSGSQAAKLNLAVLYYRGVGTARDVSLAVQMLHELAEKGDPRAQAYLGIVELAGAVVPRDPRAGEKWLSKAAKAKNPEAEQTMGVLWAFTSDHPRDLTKAVKLFRHAARQGYVPAMHALGILLEQHPEIAPNPPDEAIVMLERAAQAGSWKSSALLGTFARDGHERPQSFADAFRWFTIAQKQGGAAAERLTNANLDRCRQSLTAAQQNEELAAADAWLALHPHTDVYAFSASGVSNYPIDEVYAARSGAE